MSTQHKLIVDIDKMRSPLTACTWGVTVTLRCSSITLHQVALTVIAGGRTHLAEALGAQKGSDES